MPILMLSDAEPRTYEWLGVTVTYRLEPGDAAWADRIRIDALGGDLPRVVREVYLPALAEYVCDWSGVDELPEAATLYPARGKLPRPVDAEPGPDCVTDEDVAARIAALRRLPGALLANLHLAVWGRYREALASGKDSPPGSSGGAAPTAPST